MSPNNAHLVAFLLVSESAGRLSKPSNIEIAGKREIFLIETPSILHVSFLLPLRAGFDAFPMQQGHEQTSSECMYTVQRRRCLIARVAGYL